MGKYFEDNHADCDSQVMNQPCHIADTLQIAMLRTAPETGESLILLGDALCKQLRYREAIDCFTQALTYFPKDMGIVRKRGARYITTLQLAKARKDFMACLHARGDTLDICYRLGLCDYMLEDYGAALAWFERCYPLCDDEMGIAIIYWHTLSAYRSGSAPTLLRYYHANMEVGHHTAYEKAVLVFLNEVKIDTLLGQLFKEQDDMEYGITLYGVCIYLNTHNQPMKAKTWMKKLLGRDGFWICYAYLAAKNDAMRNPEIMV